MIRPDPVMLTPERVVSFAMTGVVVYVSRIGERTVIDPDAVERTCTSSPIGELVRVGSKMSAEDNRSQLPAVMPDSMPAAPVIVVEPSLTALTATVEPTVPPAVMHVRPIAAPLKSRTPVGWMMSATLLANVSALVTL